MAESLEVNFVKKCVAFCKIDHEEIYLPQINSKTLAPSVQCTKLSMNHLKILYKMYKLKCLKAYSLFTISAR